MHNNRIKQAPTVHSAIDNAIVYLCVRLAKSGEGRLLYSMDVMHKRMKYIAIILFVLLSIPAFSCECKEIKDLAEAQKREYSESDVILIGEVVSSDSDKGTYKVKVVEVLKGALTQKLITGKYISTCELFPHKVGEMWLIYARQLQGGAINLNGCGLSRSFNHPYIIGYFGSTPPPPNPMSKDIVIEELNGKIKEADHLQKALILMKKEIEQLRKLK